MILFDEEFYRYHLKPLAEKNIRVKNLLDKVDGDFYRLPAYLRKVIDKELKVVSRKKINVIDIEHTCHDCNCREGEFHLPGCDMERCPFCGGQLISCDCCYTQLGFTLDQSDPYYGLPKEVYEKGLAGMPGLSEKWEEILQKKGLIPYIYYPVLCARCGLPPVDFFRVPDAEWNHYIEPNHRDKVLCQECYDKIKNLIDSVKARSNI